ncbi:MAG: AAA family ATPase, partial [Nitrospira sp.]
YSPALADVASCHPVYSSQLKGAKSLLRSYFDDKIRGQSPLNCLLLGPPGAGKTYIAEAIGKTHDRNQVIEEINLSLDSDAQVILAKIGAARKRPRVVFLDEFDVTVDGSSVVRYLLDPITRKEHAKTVFIFSGSYLKNRSILNTLCRNTADFDLLRFLFDVFMSESNRDAATFVRQLHQMSALYRESKQALSPNSDLLNYLRQLHKIRDFLSRINGFVIQIPDIASPLAITDPMLALRPHEKGKRSEVFLWKGKVLPEDVREFAVKLGNNACKYQSPIEPLLDYKNMILTERLGLVLSLLPKPEWKDSEKGRDEPELPRFISHRLLNYLVMVPVEHNVRSLKFMIEHCLEFNRVEKNSIVKVGQEEEQFPNGEEFLLRKDLRLLFEMHVNKEPFFDSPTGLWRLLGATQNHDIFKRTGAELLRVPYDKEWKDEMKRRTARNGNKSNVP